MNEQAIQEQYQHIVNLLEQKRLKEAQVQLEAFLWNCNDWTLRNRLEQAKVSYQYMLQYLSLIHICIQVRKYFSCPSST